MSAALFIAAIVVVFAAMPWVTVAMRRGMRLFERYADHVIDRWSPR